MPVYNPYQDFRNNPFIIPIAGKSKWTVSTNKKMPIDIIRLKNDNIIAGARFNNAGSLVTLDELHVILPDAANYAFRLDSRFDGFVILDIEAGCPANLKSELEAMPCLYREMSMSGNGTHMAFPFPSDILKDFPDAENRTVFKDPGGRFEILMNHYITFTGRATDGPLGNESEAFRTMFRTMAGRQKPAVLRKVDVTPPKEITDPTLRDAVRILLRKMQNEYSKTAADFDNDESRYEFAVTAEIYRKLKPVFAGCENAEFIGKDYGDSDKASVIYAVAMQYLPHREKHDTERNGLPWLCYLAQQVMAKDDGNG